MQLLPLNFLQASTRFPRRLQESGLKAGILALACEAAGLAGLLLVQVSLYYLTALVGHAARLL